MHLKSSLLWNSINISINCRLAWTHSCCDLIFHLPSGYKASCFVLTLHSICSYPAANSTVQIWIYICKYNILLVDVILVGRVWVAFKIMATSPKVPTMILNSWKDQSWIDLALTLPYWPYKKQQLVFQCITLWILENFLVERQSKYLCLFF